MKRMFSIVIVNALNRKGHLKKKIYLLRANLYYFDPTACLKNTQEMWRIKNDWQKKNLSLNKNHLSIDSRRKQDKHQASWISETCFSLFQLILIKVKGVCFVSDWRMSNIIEIARASECLSLCPTAWGFQTDAYYTQGKCHLRYMSIGISQRLSIRGWHMLQLGEISTT